MEELKPCPIFHNVKLVELDYSFWRVECSCGLQGVVKKTPEEAIEVWNKLVELAGKKE
jgi:hypothetical protein